MDLLAFKPEGVVALRLMHPVDETKYVGVTVNLKSLDSPEIKALQRKHREEMLRSGKGLKLSAAKLDKQSEETLVAAIDSWTFEQGDDGEQAMLGDDPSPKCDEKNKLKLIRSVFGKQIDSALEDETQFFTKS
ncbi:hypothetical protein [Rhizobium phage RHph_X3_2]|nr:hypothetical protein [Rhizobium phage RHph_X3_2]